MKKVLGGILVIGLCCLSEAVWAKTIKSVEDDVQTVAVISARNLTHLKVADDRITAIRGVEGSFTYVAQRSDGSVFFMPTTAFASQPISVYVSTKAGHHYPLVLVPKSLPADGLLLRHKKPTKSAQKIKEKPLSEQAQIERFAEGRMVPGYQRKRVHSQPLTLHRGVSVEEVMNYSGEQHDAWVFVVTNQHKKPYVVRADSFMTPNTKTVALSTTSIPAHGQATLVILKQHETKGAA